MLRVDDHGRVRLLTFDRPDALNAMNDALYRAAADGLHQAAADPGVAVVVLTGAGRAFCAGQDMGEMRRPSGDTGGGHGFPTFMDAITTFEKPLVAAVNGVGVGVGMTMLAHCDLVLVAEGARLRAPFTALGVAPEAGSSATFPAVMGWQRAAHVLYTGEWVDAATAVELGLAWRAVPDDRLLDDALAVATDIAARPIASLVATKQLMLAARIDAIRAARAREDVAFAELIGGPANREAVAAFLEKREPDFTNLRGG